MKKKLLIIFALLLVLPLAVKADEPANVTSLDTHAEDDGNIILFSGETENSSHAVMCKLLDGDDEIDKLSVEVTNEGTDGTFGGSFIAPSTGTYTVSCANYEGGNIVTDEVTVSAMTQFTVEFDTNGGSEIAPVNVAAGQTISRPQDPTKDGKEFGGWYEDDTLTTPFDFGTRITGFITIYAKWVDPVEVQNQTRVQVIYDGGGSYQVNFATDDPDNQGPMNVQLTESANYFVDPDTEVTLTATPANGHHLAGWYASHEEEDQNNPGHMIWVEENMLSNQTTYTFTPEGEFMNIKLVFEEDTIAPPETYTVEFNTNGGSEIPPVNITSGDLVDRPDPNPTNGDLIFVGWFDDDTLTTEFDFNTPITSNTTIYAKWDEPASPPVDPGEDPVDEKTYNVPDGNGNSISFPEEEGHTFRLEITDLSNLTDAQLASMDPPMDRETYEQIKQTMVDATDPYGTLISFLDISVLDEHDSPIHNVNGQFIIKLFMTDEMKKYKSFKLIYVKDDMSFGEITELKVEGNYLVGRLPHLSTYILAGSNDEATTTSDTTTAKPPKTYDGIMTWVIALVVSLGGLTTLVITNKKKKRN